ncbi:MAG: hypothetical protein U0521_16350 [Anaerolineae bacterium]
MLRRSSLWVVAAVVLFALILVIFVRDAQAPPAPVALPLTESFDQSPTGFTLMYPAEWETQIPAAGIAIFGPAETLSGTEPGPTLTVQRANPLSVVGTLDAALDSYLNNGPLSDSDRWRITDPVQTVQIDGRDARSVSVQGSDSDGAPEMHARIVITSADNTFVYFFITAVPVDKRDRYDPTFDAMLASVRILE